MNHGNPPFVGLASLRAGRKLQSDEFVEFFRMQWGHVDVVEDDDSLRNSISDLLGFAGYRVRAWRDAEAFLDNLPQTAPAVVVTDMRMPGRSGVEMHTELVARGRSMPVIYISGESSVPQSIEAMKLGALDFLVKPFSREDLLKAVAAGMEKDRRQMQQLIEQARFDQALAHLSPREREVLELLLKGFNNTEIVDALSISLPTAKQYKSQIMRKLGARSLSELMKLHRKEAPVDQN
jgi:RNA polymerase sigma factor (sigma-70 family)